MKEQLQTLNDRIPRVGKHILFWLAYVGFLTLVWGSFEVEYLQEFQAQLIYLPPKLFAAYLTLYWLLPRYLIPARYGIFFILLFVLLLFSGFLQWATALYIYRPLFYPQENWGALFYPAKILKNMTGVYPIVVLAALIKLIKIWYRDQQIAQKMTHEKLQAELKFLKAQIHPHFLFNTLNNLYALTLKKSEKAPELILKLSDLLNYMLYECNVPLMQLSKEIKQVENYISLERIRYGDRLKVTWSVKGEMESCEIAPMLILPFIENSFKHGASDKIDEVAIDLTIATDDQRLTLEIVNSKGNNESRDAGQYKEGIGLKNVKRRLDLLYPGNYELKIMDQDETYQVILKLNMIKNLTPGLDETELHDRGR